MPEARPRLAVTLGDPAGVGPELVARALADGELAAGCRLAVYGSARLLERARAAAGAPRLPGSIEVLPRLTRSRAASDAHVVVDAPGAPDEGIEPGRVQAACGRLARAWIGDAVRDTRAGLCDALVTAPLNKAALAAAGVPFPGHTELLAHLTGAADPCMAFHEPGGLFVSLATIHEPLAAVPRLLDTARLLRTIRLTADACARFGCAAPRVGVLALNPHAGEHGLFGDEEARVIEPAIEQARRAGVDARGPLVPDTAFVWLGAGRRGPPPFDAYVAMYHDQALIPFKLAAFDTGVNLTLGLPLIRTSPDHGTAFDLAWQGRASPASLFSAIRLAARLARTTPPAGP